MVVHRSTPVQKKHKPVVLAIMHNRLFQKQIIGVFVLMQLGDIQNTCFVNRGTFVLVSCLLTFKFLDHVIDNLTRRVTELGILSLCNRLGAMNVIIPISLIVYTLSIPQRSKLRYHPHHSHHYRTSQYLSNLHREFPMNPLPVHQPTRPAYHHQPHRTH